MNMDHLKFLDIIAQEDVDSIKRKEQTYRGSWKKRGGVGAFMMMARKWDRIEVIVKIENYDIFESIHTLEGDDGTMIAEIRDMRRYLLLIEAEMLSRNHKESFVEENRPGTPEDGGHHAINEPT
jgi:hypothetical protein